MQSNIDVFHVDNAPDDAVYVGRGTPWDNPFKIGKDGDRYEVIRKFRRRMEFLYEFQDGFNEWIGKLTGKNLK